VTGVLRGFDQFMNIVLDETIDEGSSDKNDIGLVVSTSAEGGVGR
jgi:small nuclear ribonucleoprotein G